LKDATHQREKLIAEAKQAWKRKQEASSDTTREHHSIKCGSLHFETWILAHATQFLMTLQSLLITYFPVITDPEDPHFDFERLITKWEKSS